MRMAMNMDMELTPTRGFSSSDVRPAGVWEDFVVKDGRLVSGTNPQSARSAAYAAVHAFDTL